MAGQRFGLSLSETRAVLAAPAHLHSVPEADAFVLGLAPDGEGALPVVALADLLGLSRGPSTRVVVVEIGGAPVGLRGRARAGRAELWTAARCRPRRRF